MYLLHERLIQLTGGRSGLRDPGLLASGEGVARSQASFDGEEFAADLWTKAAALLRSLIKNHPFVDRNKRTAVTTTGVFLAPNGQRLTASNDEVLRFAVKMAGEQTELKEIAAWLKAHSSKA
ncbi:MAG: type II toxin-antitoxin system death-on-curing family toxin [Anaerolineae bacterium]